MAISLEVATIVAQHASGERYAYSLCLVADPYLLWQLTGFFPMMGMATIATAVVLMQVHASLKQLHIVAETMPNLKSNCTGRQFTNQQI
jgi:hypothetical protein